MEEKERERSMRSKKRQGLVLRGRRHREGS
jgi:hypothetical protein